MRTPRRSRVATATPRVTDDVEEMIREWRAFGIDRWSSRVAPPAEAPAGTPIAAAVPGAVVEFEGIPVEFSAEPFMVTFDVHRSELVIGAVE